MSNIDSDIQKSHKYLEYEPNEYGTLYNFQYDPFL